MKQYNIAEAKSHFSELVKRALLGEEIVIARDNKGRRPGSAKGQILSVASDFDDLPVDFKEYC